jgi:hypothetical protein
MCLIFAQVVLSFFSNSKFDSSAKAAYKEVHRRTNKYKEGNKIRRETKFCAMFCSLCNKLLFQFRV